jgi:hypothetical protein
MKTELLRSKIGFSGGEKETRGVGREILSYNMLLESPLTLASRCISPWYEN